MNGYWFTIALAQCIAPLFLVFPTGRPRVGNVMPLVLAMVVLLSLALTFFDYWIKLSVSDARSVSPVCGGRRQFRRDDRPALLFLILSLPVECSGGG
jgi:hypothetical protein